MKLEKERIYWENGIYWLKFGCKFCSFLGKISEFWLLFGVDLREKCVLVL